MTLPPGWRIAGTALLASALLAAPAARSGSSLKQVHNPLPLVFEPNRGQTDSTVQYLSRGGRHSLLLQQKEAVLVLRKETGSESVRMRFEGTATVDIEGESPLPGRSNYLIGNDRAKWRTDIPHFGRVRYRSVYPGVDLVYYGNEGKLEYDFVVAAGADPSRIRFRLEGARSIQLAANGDLILTLAKGETRHHKPVVYQEIGGARTPVEGAYVLKGTQVSFALGRYDRSKQLVIDPVLSWGGYIGGTSADTGQTIAVDSLGNAYIAGQTQSVTGFPIVNALQTVHGGSGSVMTDAFVTKINATGTAISYSTYLGGANLDTAGAIAVNQAGEAFITGETNSPNFPTASPFRGTLSGVLDAFLVKLNAAGNTLLYGTYLGGGGVESGKGIAVDANGAMYIAGFTNSSDLPNIVSGQGLSGDFDGFVIKLTPSGQQVSFSAYVGGTLLDYVLAMALDSNQNIYVTGRSASTNLPQTGSFQPGNAGMHDAFVSKLNSSGARVYWTYLGGSATDYGQAIAVDATGAVFVGGETGSSNFPVTAGSFQSAFGGATDAFVVKLSPSGAALLYSTYVGGGGPDFGLGIAINSTGYAYITGQTASTNFPVVSSVKTTDQNGSDAFITKLAPNGTKAVYSTLAGGDGIDKANGIAVDAAGSAYVTGLTLSPNLLATIPANALNGIQDAFFMKFSECAPTLTPASASIVVGGQSGSFAVQAPAGCRWTAFATASFIQLSSASGVGPGTVNYTVGANAGASRSGSIIIEGSTFAISQAGGSSGFSAPYNIDIVPASGSGMSATFTARYGTARPSGAAIERAYVLINTTVNAAASCFVEYTVSSNTFRLIKDNGTDWNTPVIPGSGSITSNSQCSLNATGASASASIPTSAVSQLDLVLPLTFSASFAGAKTVHLLAVNETQALNSGWEAKGTWTIPSSPSPGQVGVRTIAPSNGAGPSGTFTSTFTHTGGANSHYLGYTLFLPTPNVVNYTATGSCLVEYNRISNGMRLIDNAGTGWLGGQSGIPLGTPGATLSNNQCSVNVQTATASVGGTLMTVTAQVSFNASMGPVLGTFLQALDVNGIWTGMTQMGNWVIPGAPQTSPGPSIVGLSPSSVSGSSTTYIMSASHTSGFAALTMIHLRITSAIVGQPACQLVYFPGDNTLNLIDAAGLALISPAGVTPGTGTTLSNGLCSLNTAGSTAGMSGNIVTVVTPVTFTVGSFSGAKNAYVVAFDNAGLLTHWVQGGTLTIQ